MTAYRPLGAEDLRHYLASLEHLSRRIGHDPAIWTIREVSDGNLNLVHIVEGDAGGVCVKQALPHVRVLPSWKMPLDRALFEARYLRAVTPFVAGMIPELLHEDADLYLLVVERLSPHVVLRTALADNAAAPGFSATVGSYVARASFFGSSIAQPFEHMAHKLALFSGNTALTRITVDLILTDPFGGSDRNRVDHPDLNATVARLQGDAGLRIAAGRLQERFLCAAQTLLHGDLHTGSVMLRPGHDAAPDIRVIDGEFAHCGPIGFDCGLYLANLALHALARPSAAAAMRGEAALFWRSFDTEFRAHWRDHAGGGDVFRLTKPSDLPGLMDRYLGQVRDDMAGFMGAEMIRRTIGFAHVSDWDLCASHGARMDAMRAAMLLGRELMLNPARLDTVWDDISLRSK